MNIGDIIAEKYRVERVLGEGGIGIVVAARHEELHELRAIKFMLSAVRDNPTMIERFLREARATVRLKSEHVVTIYDVGRLPGGEPYMVMEYLEGLDLDALLKKNGPLPITETVDHILQALEGIAEAHAAGIVHRDLKPANLFLTTSADGMPCVKVLDFGISKLTAGATDIEITKSEALLGSPAYMSPEQMRAARNVNARTDIWAIGAILYRLLTGVLPFDAETIVVVFLRVMQEQPERPVVYRPDNPDELEAVIFRCLNKNPEHRYPDVAALAADLVTFGSERAPLSLERIARMTTPSSPGLEVSDSGPFPQPPSSSSGLHGAPGSQPQSVGTAPGWGSTYSDATPSGSKRLILAIAIAGFGALLITGITVAVVGFGSGKDASPASASTIETSVEPSVIATAEPTFTTDSTEAVTDVPLTDSTTTASLPDGGQGGSNATPVPQKPRISKRRPTSRPVSKPDTTKTKPADPFGGKRR